MPAGTILFSTFGARGDLYPYIAVAQQLQQLGHQTIIATSETFRQEILAAGLQFHPVRPTPDPKDLTALMDPFRGSENLFRRVLLPSLRETVEDLLPAAEMADILVTHTTSIAGPIVAALQEKRGLKWASGVISPLALLSVRDAPALSPAPLLADRNPTLNRIIVGTVRRQYGAFLKPANALRRELGLPAAGNILCEAAHSPTLALGLFSPLLAPPQKDWPPGLRAVGFCIPSMPQSLPEPVRDFLKTGDPPLLFLSASFSHDNQSAGLTQWMESAVAAARELNTRVLFLGPPAQSGDHFLSAPYASLAEVLPRIGAMVHEGGIGTLALGLHAGTRMLLSPLAHDQPDTARMARRAGIAHVLQREDFSASRLFTALKGLLEDEKLGQRLPIFREKIQQEPGAAGAAAAIDQLVGRSN